MKRTILIPALVCVASIVSCGRSDHGSVLLSALCANPTPNQDGCEFSAGSCNRVNADGFLNVDLAVTQGTLLAPIQIDNLRLDNSDVTTGRTNTNTAIIERFDMRYDVPGVKLSASFAQTATVPTGGSTVVVVALIPPSAGATIAGAIGAGPANAVIHVKAHGRYADDTQFDTAEYAVPAIVINGGSTPFACTGTNSGKTPACCPQDGQTAACTCL
jgi:hypothetical protein